MTDEKKPGTELTGELLDAMPPQQALAEVGANPYLRMIEKLVMAGGDLTSLDRILDLQLKWEANEARKAYVADMAAFKAEPMVIGKNKHVSFTTSKGKTEYDHAELSDVTEVVVPRLAKHGFSHAWKVKQAGSAITVSCTITHRLGHSESVEMTAPPDDSGGKNTIQAIGSTKSYLERYTLLAAVGMATGGDDNDGRGDLTNNEPVTADDAAKVVTWQEAIAAATDVMMLRAIKNEMVTAYGGALKIPKAIIATFNERWDAIVTPPPAKAAS